MRAREQRHKILVRARMRAGSGASEIATDICVRDVSTRGMLLQSSAPPARGTYVEISLPLQTVVGRVIWTAGRRFGIGTRDRIDLVAIVGARAGRGSDAPGGESSGNQRFQRGKAPTFSPSTATRIEFGALLLFAIAIVAIMSDTAYQTLSRPFEAVAAQMRSRD